MPRNFSRLVMVLGAALLAVAPSLHAQSGQPVRGDVDGDGRVTAADARIVSDFLVGKPVPAGANVRVRGDVNGDGRVTSVDAAIIARAAAGRDVSRFPVGKAVPEGAFAIVECAADVRAHTLSCGAPGAAGDARGNIIVGGQNLNVKLTSSPPTINPADSTFAFTVTVQNLLRQAMAADSGTGIANASGVRVFFHSGPTMTQAAASGSGTTVRVQNFDGKASYTGNGPSNDGQPYFQYAGPALGADGILSPQETSTAKNWILKYDSGVNKFSFLLFVSTEVRYPAGWVDIYPPNDHYSSPDSVFADTVVAGRSLQLADSVRNRWGTYIPGAPVTWSATSNGFAGVSPTGLVTTTAGASGVDTVTATNGPRSGRVVIVVTPPTGANSVISASPLSVQVGDTSLITVQVKDGFGHDVTSGGDAVLLSTSLDSLVAPPNSGTTAVPAIYAGNGMYTAKLTGHVAGTATITGTVNGQAIGTTATVTFTAAAPENIVKTGGDEQSGLVGGAVANPFTVHVTDHYGNSVPNVTINLAVAGGNGSFSGSAVVTDGSGNASVPAAGWTLGNGGSPPRTTNQLSATAVGGLNPSTTFVAYVPAFALAESSDAVGNTKLDSNTAPNVPNALANDYTINGGGVSLKPASVGVLNTVRGGKVTMAADGSFTYLPPVGIVLRDSVPYDLQDIHYTGPAQPQSTGYLKFSFVGKVWYVRNTFAGSADGTSEAPFTTMAAAAAAAGVNDSILVEAGSGTTGGGTLKAGQWVYGQGASAPFTLPLNGGTITLLTAGSAPSVGALTLGTGGIGNTLRGFTSSGGISSPGIGNFGILTVSEVAINNPTGPALTLATGGTLSGNFTTVISGGGTNNVLLTNVNGTSTLGAAGNSLSGASGDGVVITGGSGSFTFPGNVSNGNASTFAVNVNGKTGGTVTFSGSINPSAAGQGISVTGNSSGANTVVFSGGIKNISSGTASGVFLNNNTGATISFTGGGLTIATTTGTPFTATNGGTVQVSTDGGSNNTLSATGNAANVVNLSGITLGAGGMSFFSISSSGTPTGSAFSATSVGNTSGSTFTAGSLTVTGTSGASSRGLALTTNSAPFTFTAVTINNTGGEGIYLNGNTGAVNVNGGNVGTTTSTTGDALAVSGGNAAISVAANLGKTSAGRIASIASHTAGAVAVSGTLSCTSSCTGINVASNSGGSITFSNATQTLNTGASAAVTLSSNSGATIDFTGGSLAITTTSGAGFNATGGGTVSVQGANNSVNSTGGGTAVNVSATTIAGTGLTFKSVNATGSGTNGIVLSNTGSGPFTVTGDGNSDPNNTTRGRTTAKEGGGTVALGSGGTISGRSGHGVSLATTGAVTLRNMAITGSASSGDGINASSTGRLTIDNTRITAHASDHGLWGSSVSGLAIHHSEIDNNGTTVGVVEGPDIWNVRLLGLTGTDSIRNSNIHHSQEDVLGILNSSGTLNLTVLNTNITDTGTGAGGTTAFVVSADGTANVTVNLQNDSILRGRSRGVDIGTGTASSAVLNTTINNSQFHQNGAAISIVHGSSGTNTFNVTNNNLQSNDANSLQAMIINRAASPSFNGFGLFTGTISGNTIGTAGTAHSGSGTSSGIEVESNGSGGITRVAVVNNTIRQVATHGIQVAAVDGNLGGTTAPLVEARVQGNNISVLNPIGLDGINILSGALNTDDVTMCLDIISNTSTGIRNGLRVRGSGAPTAPATVQLEGWDGSTARATYFANRPNTLAGGIAAYNENTPSAPGGYVAVANCNTP